LKGHPGAAVEALTTDWRSKFRFEPPYDHPHMVREVKLSRNGVLGSDCAKLA
jgi:hypothetical protein